MSKLTKQENWKRWSPKTIFLKKNDHEQRDILYKKRIIEKNLYTYSAYPIHAKDMHKKLEIDEMEKIKKQEYKKGFERGYETHKTDKIIFKKKFNQLFIDFNKSLFMHEKLLFAHVLKTVLIVSSYVIGKNITFDKDLLLKNIKKIIVDNNVLLKKPQLIIHPNNKKLVEKTFLEFLNIHNWKLVYDTKIDVNSCQVKSESGDIDATMNARWQSVCQLVNSEEYSCI